MLSYCDVTIVIIISDVVVNVYPPVLSHVMHIFSIINCVNLYRKGLSTVMKAKADQLEVKLLLFAIQKTTAFEKFLAQRFISSSYMASVRHAQ